MMLSGASCRVKTEKEEKVEILECKDNRRRSEDGDSLPLIRGMSVNLTGGIQRKRWNTANESQHRSEAECV